MEPKVLFPQPNRYYYNPSSTIIPSTPNAETRPFVGDIEGFDPNYIVRTADRHRFWGLDVFGSFPGKAEACDDASVFEANEADDTRPGRPSKRNRVRNEAQWKANTRKRKRNQGEEYFTRKGKAVKGKTLEDMPCGCSHQCNKKVTFETRKEIFSEFWKLGDWSTQNAYLVGLIKVNAIKQRDPRVRKRRPGVEEPIIPKKTPRKFAREYNVLNSSGVTTVVCKTFFLETFNISNGRLDRAMQTASAGLGPRADQRGHKEPKNKTPKIVIEELQKFISTFPKYESRHCQENSLFVSPGKLHFGPGLTVAKLYSTYVEDCKSNSRQFMSEQVFRKTLKKDFKLTFHHPLKDTSKTRDKK